MIVSFGLVQLENLIEVDLLADRWGFKEVYRIVFAVLRVVLFCLLQDSLDRKFHNLFMSFLRRCDAIQFQAIIDGHFHVFDPWTLEAFLCADPFLRVELQQMSNELLHFL